MPFVASTMTSDVVYHLYSDHAKGQNSIATQTKKRSILIKGQAGVAQKEKSGRLWTPDGTMNHVSEDDLELLKKDGTFQTHLKFGAVKIIAAKASIEKVAKDMPKDTKSGPLTEKDYKPGGRATIPDHMKPGQGKALQ